MTVVRHQIILMFVILLVVSIPVSVYAVIITDFIPVSSVFDGGTYTEMLGAEAVTGVNIGGSTYALVTAFDDDGIQIIDITNPSSPLPVIALNDGSGYNELSGANAIVTAVIGSNTYSFSTAFQDDGVQIIDITNPSSPINTAEITQSSPNYTSLNGPVDIAITTIGSDEHLVIAALPDNGVQIIDVSTPSVPVGVAALTHSDVGFETLTQATGVDVATIDGSTYAFVTSQFDHGVQIIDISTPSVPVAVGSIIDETNGFTRLNSAQAIAITTIDSNVYAVVVSDTENAIQIIDITNPFSPVATSTLGVASTPDDVTIFTLDSNTFAMVTRETFNGVAIIDITDPSNPVTVDDISDGVGGFDALNFPQGISSVVIDSKVYGLVAGRGDDGMQVFSLELEYPVNLSDSVGFSDILTASKSMTVILTESISLLDAVSNSIVNTFFVVLSDSIGISDTVSNNMINTFFVILSDSIGLSDLINIVGPVPDPDPTPDPDPDPVANSGVGSETQSNTSKKSSGGSGRINVSPDEMSKKSGSSHYRVSEWVSSGKYFKIGVRDIVAHGFVDYNGKIPTTAPHWFYNVGQAWDDGYISSTEYYYALQFLLDNSIIVK